MANPLNPAEEQLEMHLKEVGVSTVAELRDFLGRGQEVNAMYVNMFIRERCIPLPWYNDEEPHFVLGSERFHADYTDEVITHIEVFYMPLDRLWIVSRMNKINFQVGPCDYLFSKQQVLDYCKNNNESVPIHLFKNGNQLVKVYKQ